MDHKKPYFYLITFLLVIAVTIFFDYLVGLANDTKTYRSVITSFRGEVAPINTYTNSLLPNLNNSFVGESPLVGNRVVRTDQFGVLQGPEKNHESGIGIVFLGGSTTENNEVNEEYRFPFLVSSTLNKFRENFNSFNLGVRAHTTQNSINLYINHPSSNVQKAKYVVVMHNINDRLKLGIDGNYSAKLSTYSAYSFSGFFDNFKNLISSFWKYLVSNSNLIFLFDLQVSKLNSESNLYITESNLDKYAKPTDESVIHFENNLKLLISVIRTKDATPILMTQPLGFESEGQNLFNDSIRKITKKFNVHLIDLDKESRKVSDKKNLFFSDGIHFNNHGSKWAADVISNSFLKYPELTFEVKKLNQSCPPLFFGKNNFVNAPLSVDIFPGRYPSPDKYGKRLLYQDYKEGKSSISILNTSNGQHTLIIEKIGENSIEHPIWFDDSKFIYGEKNGFNRKLYLYDLDKKISKPILTDPNLFGAIANVSSRGEIAFAGYTKIGKEFTNPEIYYMKSIDSTPVKLTSTKNENWRPFFNVAEDSIYYISAKDDQKFGLYKINLQSRLVSPVTKNSSLTHWDPAISSDGLRLTYAVKDSSNFDIFLVDLRNQSKLLRKTFSSEDEWDPNFSYDGRYLFYAATSPIGSQIRAICIN